MSCGTSQLVDLSRPAEVLNQCVGSQNESVNAQLADKELLKQFREVELLSSEDKHLVKTFINAFITKRHVQQLAK